MLYNFYPMIFSFYICHSNQIYPFRQFGHIDFIGTQYCFHQLPKGVIYPYFGGFNTFDHHLVNYRIGVNN